MQYFRITGVDDYGDRVEGKYIIETKYNYADNLHFAIDAALPHLKLCWDDFAEGITSKFFNDLIDSGTKTIEIHGWAGKFTIELFVDEQDEYFVDLFKVRPHPWKWENNIGECGNGGVIHGVVDANGECIISTYDGYLAAEAVWNFYQYYVNKEGKTK